MSNRFRAGVSLAVVLSAACGPLRHRPDDPASVVFVNQSLDQADVYAVSSSAAQMRIGTVMPGRTQTLSLPHTMVPGMLRVVARVLSKSVAPSTEPLSVTAGWRAQVTPPVDEKMLTVLPVRAP